jgi:hypothetical protein
VIHRVPRELVEDLWPALEPHAKAALEYHPFMDEQDLLLLVNTGHVTLFIALDKGAVQGFGAMEVIEYPRRKVANCIACGGERGFLSAAIHELLPALKRWGSEQGADTFAILGARPGWLRALRDEGGNAAEFVTWWTRLGNVQGRRQTDADHDERAVESSPALSH